ncbi:expressed unknown protein [Seminavis robusta]|uniref:Uncharacterized protein n=1 Tax=Seminavis robusta TaxID=568900 RepID=A0A9N8HH67_9STRA|nr:expressed unknown protein [Seminavis robusta]|eukprot:Sro521_g159420.1 n/a (161) ;mRNA; f:43243-43725
MGLFGGDSDKDNNNILKGLFQPQQEQPGLKTVITIPVEKVKPRPLRFFLQIYIVGQQNQKDSQSWLPREDEEGGLQIYYKDGTGMCQIGLQPNAIQIQRHGERPSLEYMLQESVMLHGVLDELYKIAFDEVEDVEESQRLLKLDPAAIEAARKTLPARQA